MINLMKAVPVAATVSLFAFVLGSSIPAASQSKDEWDQVIAAAKKEGRVVVYSGNVSPDTHNAINKAFEQKYGIPVELLVARGTEIRERVRTEQASGRFLADVWHTALSNMTTGANDQQFTQPHGGLPNIVNLKPEFAARVTPYSAPVFTLNYGFLVNSRMVSPEEEPKNWPDLLDPKWKGKILSDDPRASGGGRVMFQMTVDKYGRQYQEKLAQQNLVFTRDYQEAVRRVARGEYPIYIPFEFLIFPTLQGLPVRYVVPKDGATYGSYGAPLFKNAPHPNAARLFSNFYLSDEAQGIYARNGYGIVVKEVSEKLTPEQKALANVPTLVEEDFAHINEMLALAKEIYK